jgi:tRNA(Ile)-lysidine synthase
MHPFETAAAAGLGNWPEGTVFLAAVSGGADSTAMLAALAPLRSPMGFKLSCLHVDHGIRSRAESRGDAGAVAALCEKLDVPCTTVSITPGRVAETAKRRGAGIEAAARLFRHAAWNQEARRTGAARILVAHTREDLLETALMRFLRGSGPAGLAAMPRERGRILRPLLALSRAEALRYLAARDIPYRTDSTNADPRFLRNRIRAGLIPCLDELFPGWENAVLRAAETQRLAADFIKAEAESRLSWQEKGPREYRTSGAGFFSQPEIIREEALFAAADRLEKEAPPGKGSPDYSPRRTRTPRRAALRLFTRGAVPALDLGPVRLENRGGELILTPRKTVYEEDFSLLIKAPGHYKLKGLSIVCSDGSSLGPEQNGAGGFFADLPLVFRRNFKDDYSDKRGSRPGGRADRSRRFEDTIAAADGGGIAAFIEAARGVTASREARGGFFITVENTGGIDVQRSE